MKKGFNLNKLRNFHTSRHIVVLGLLGISCVMIFLASSMQPSKNSMRDIDPLLGGEIHVGTTTLSVEVPRTAKERERGLSGRLSLEVSKGMFFIFDKPDVYGFWMPDMHFPIDIIWIDSDFRIVDIVANVSPDSYPRVFYPSSPSSYALEVNAGLARHLDWSVGTHVQFHVNP